MAVMHNYYIIRIYQFLDKEVEDNLLGDNRSLGKADLAHVESMSFFQKNLIV